MKIDQKSRMILHALQQNARTTVADLARMVGLAETTVRERVNHLEREGVIQGYHARVDPAKLGYGASGVVRADCDEASTREICAELVRVPEVRRVQVVTGERRLQVELIAPDLAGLERAVEERVRTLGLTNVDVSVLLGSHELHRPVLIDPPVAAAPASNGVKAPQALAHAR